MNKKRHWEFGRAPLRLALQASFRFPAVMEVVKHIKTQCFFNIFGMKIKKTQCFSIVLKVPFWPCLARGGHLPRPAVSHLSALCALIFLRPISEATKMSSRPYKSGPLNFQGELSALSNVRDLVVTDFFCCVRRLPGLPLFGPVVVRSGSPGRCLVAGTGWRAYLGAPPSWSKSGPATK